MKTNQVATIDSSASYQPELQDHRHGASVSRGVPLMFSCHQCQITLYGDRDNKMQGSYLIHTCGAEKKLCLNYQDTCQNTVVIIIFYPLFW